MIFSEPDHEQLRIYRCGRPGDTQLPPAQREQTGTVWEQVSQQGIDGCYKSSICVCEYVM